MSYLQHVSLEEKQYISTLFIIIYYFYIHTVRENNKPKKERKQLASSGKVQVKFSQTIKTRRL